MVTEADGALVAVRGDMPDIENRHRGRLGLLSRQGSVDGGEFDVSEPAGATPAPPRADEAWECAIDHAG